MKIYDAFEYKGENNDYICVVVMVDDEVLHKGDTVIIKLIDGTLVEREILRFEAFQRVTEIRKGDVVGLRVKYISPQMVKIEENNNVKL